MFSILIPVILAAVVFFFENSSEKKKKPERAQQPRRAVAKTRVPKPEAPAPVAVKRPAPPRRPETGETPNPAPFLKGETVNESTLTRSLEQVAVTSATPVRPPARNLRAAIIWGEILKRKF